MRQILLFIVLFFSSTILLGQNNKVENTSLTPANKNYKFIKLKNIGLLKKVVVIEVGQKAIMYFNLNEILDETKKNISSADSDDYNWTTYHYLDSLAKNNDTVDVNNYDSLLGLKLFICTRLMSGDAKIYYQKKKVFVRGIFSRLEMYGNNVDKFFFFSDNRPFFGVRWYSDFWNPDYEANKKDESQFKMDEEKRFKSILEH